MLGSVLQGAVGFGFGMLVVPLIVWTGLPLPNAIAITVGAVAIQCAWNSYQYRRHIRWRSIWAITAGRLATLPLGVGALALLAEFGQDRIKQAVGLVLLVTVMAQWLFQIKPSRHLHWGWSVLAGTVSGFTLGLVGMGAGPMVMWVMAHRWSSRQMRVFMWVCFLLLVPMHVVLMALRFDRSTVLIAVATGLAFAPVSIVGSMVGQKLGETLLRPQLRAMAFVFLVLVAIVSISAPLLVRF